jgi:ferredoxin-NADP reductase
MTATDAPRATAWQQATLVSARDETPRVKTLRFEVAAWPGHVPGQHVDVRLTAEDGYRAERSYSIASPPEWPGVEITVERLDDGEVSPFLTGQLATGDTIELRGPIGRYFAWSAAGRTRPLLLVGGGSGVVPLMCMLRHRQLAGSTVPAALLYSARTREDVIYGDELATLAGGAGLTVRITLTRDRAPGWAGGTGRIGLPVVQELLRGLGGEADSFVCGGNPFVEAASALLLEAGQPREAIRTERFGSTGA